MLYRFCFEKIKKKFVSVVVLIPLQSVFHNPQFSSIIYSSKRFGADLFSEIIGLDNKFNKLILWSRCSMMISLENFGVGHTFDSSRGNSGEVREK